jgi:hypothetical protein
MSGGTRAPSGSSPSVERAVQIAYFDESGNHTDADIFAVGGCVATQAAWGALQNEWQEVLRAGGVRYFHMSEYESRVRQFNGWEDERRVPFLRRLHAVFAEHVGAGIGRAVLKTAYQKMSNGRLGSFGAPGFKAFRRTCSAFRRALIGSSKRVPIRKVTR